MRNARRGLQKSYFNAGGYKLLYHIMCGACVQILNKLSREINTFEINYACLVNALYILHRGNFLCHDIVIMLKEECLL